MTKNFVKVYRALNDYVARAIEDDVNDYLLNATGDLAGKMATGNGIHIACDYSRCQGGGRTHWTHAILTNCDRGNLDSDDWTIAITFDDITVHQVQMDTDTLCRVLGTAVPDDFTVGTHIVVEGYDPAAGDQADLVRQVSEMYTNYYNDYPAEEDEDGESYRAWQEESFYDSWIDQVSYGEWRDM